MLTNARTRWAACLLLAIVTGCAPSGPPPGAGQAGPVAVTVAQPLIVQTVDWDPFTGRLDPIEEVEVRARVTGYVVSHHFEEGQEVEKGQLLFVIDTRPYAAALAQAKASQEEAVARQQQAVAGLAEARAKRQQVSAALDLARAQLRRARPLLPSGAITQDEYDVLESSALQAEADAIAADASIESAAAQQIAAEAGIATAKAAVEAAELDLGYCRIVAPISGRISRMLVTEGNLIGGNSLETPLTTIVSSNPIHAYFDASEQDLLKYIRLDKERKRASSRDVKTPVYMRLMDETGFPHQGYIDFVDNRVDQSTGSIRTRAIFRNDERVLVPGVFVEVRVPASGAKPRVLIPDSAIATDQASKLVYTVGEGNKIKALRITTGSKSKGLRVVTDGLTGEESIVIAGLQRCREGVEVKAETGQIELGDDEGLPDTYEPVPPEKWIHSESPATPVTGGAAE